MIKRYRVKNNDEEGTMSRLDKHSWVFEQPVAHRGLHDETGPENSLPAFQKAIDAGYPIELDLHVLKCGRVVVFHDDDLKRMTGVDKPVEATTYEEIKDLKLKDSTETIPLFEVALKLIKGRVPLMVELKSSQPTGKLEKAVMALLEDYSGDYVVQSFNPYILGWFKKNAPEVIRGQLSGSLGDKKMNPVKKKLLQKMCLNFISKPDYINYEVNYSAHVNLKKYRKKGFKILGFTVRSEADYEKAMPFFDNIVFEFIDPRKYQTDRKAKHKT